MNPNIPAQLTCKPPCTGNPVETLPENPPLDPLGLTTAGAGGPVTITTPIPEYDHTILCEPGTGTRVMVTAFHNPGNPPTFEAFLLDGTAYAGSISALVSCAAEGGITDVIVQCMVDDTAGDGSNVVTFSRLFARTIAPDGTVSSTLIGDFTDETAQTPYASVGTVTLASDFGSPAITDQRRFSVSNGATWSPSGDLRAYALRVVSGTGVTYTDSNGVTTPLVAGETLTYDADVNGVFDTAPILTTTAGDTVIVSATAYGV